MARLSIVAICTYILMLVNVHSFTPSHISSSPTATTSPLRLSSQFVPSSIRSSSASSSSSNPVQFYAKSTQNLEYDDKEGDEEESSSSSSLSQWTSNHKMNIAATSAALITTAAVAALTFANPSTALASTPSASDLMVAASSGSTSAFMTKLSETGFYQAFSLVFVSEIGDKTFFIAGLLAMKAGRLISLIGSVGALAVMTVISVIIGQLFHAVPPGLSQGLPLDDIAAVLAFAFFGLKTLKEASDIDDSDEGESGMDEEFAEAEEAVEGSQTIKEVTSW